MYVLKLVDYNNTNLSVNIQETVKVYTTYLNPNWDLNYVIITNVSMWHGLKLYRTLKECQRLTQGNNDICKSKIAFQFKIKRFTHFNANVFTKLYIDGGIMLTVLEKIHEGLKLALNCNVFLNRSKQLQISYRNTCDNANKN